MMDMETARAVARRIAQDGGHFLGLFQPAGDRAASAECIHPGCNMGLTVDLDGPVPIHGAAFVFPCAGTPEGKP